MSTRTCGRVKLSPPPLISFTIWKKKEAGFLCNQDFYLYQHNTVTNLNQLLLQSISVVMCEPWMCGKTCSICYYNQSLTINSFATKAVISINGSESLGRGLHKSPSTGRSKKYSTSVLNLLAPLLTGITVDLMLINYYTPCTMQTRNRSVPCLEYTVSELQSFESFLLKP